MKECKYHGNKYQNIKGSSLCLEHNCITSVIKTYLTKGRLKHYLMTINSVDAFDDYVAYITEKLLAEQEKGKPAVINYHFLFFNTSHFVRDALLKQAAQETLDEIQTTITDNENNPESIFFTKELLHGISNRFGECWSLYFLGEINFPELLRSDPISSHKFRAKLNNIQDFVLEYMRGHNI